MKKAEPILIVDNPRVPTDLAKAIALNKKAKETWAQVSPLARRDWVYWLITAKQAETRKRRIAKAVSILSEGRKRVCCFGGVEWLIKTGVAIKAK